MALTQAYTICVSLHSANNEIKVHMIKMSDVKRSFSTDDSSSLVCPQIIDVLMTDGKLYFLFMFFHLTEAAPE